MIRAASNGDTGIEVWISGLFFGLRLGVSDISRVWITLLDWRLGTFYSLFSEAKMISVV